MGCSRWSRLRARACPLVGRAAALRKCASARPVPSTATQARAKLEKRLHALRPQKWRTTRAVASGGASHARARATAVAWGARRTARPALLAPARLCLRAGTLRRACAVGQRQARGHEPLIRRCHVEAWYLFAVLLPTFFLSLLLLLLCHTLAGNDVAQGAVAGIAARLGSRANAGGAPVRIGPRAPSRVPRAAVLACRRNLVPKSMTCAQQAASTVFHSAFGESRFGKERKMMKNMLVFPPS
mmetsp:Transcript_25281/g.80365  ORF Transcript_25281/g.80365 Transcript_25281/m.80365 type:complete len:242 (+) Transcript_25281:1299-2024(+)